MAQYGHSFGQTISYIALKSEYLAGRGYGSSYIAEVMQDYGWFGIIMINIVYGILMKNAKFVKKNEYLVNMFICYMIVGLIYAPRSTAIGPFMKIFSFNAILANIIVWIVAKLIYMRGKNIMYDKIILIDSYYPFGKGENFLANEIKYMINAAERIYVFPIYADDLKIIKPTNMIKLSQCR